MKAINGIRLAICLALMATLAACQAFSTTSVPALPTTAPLTGSNASVVGAGALALLQEPGRANYSLTPISAESGQPVPGFTPVDFGFDIAYAFSADRTRLAFTAIGAGGCAKLCLHVLNLRTWQETQKPVPLSSSGPVNWNLLTLNPDASMAVVAFNYPSRLASQLMLIDLAQGKVAQEISLDQSVLQMAFTPDGALALHGDAASAQGKGFEAGVLLLDGRSLQIKWQQDLAMVQYGDDESQMNLTDPSQGKYLYPAITFSADNRRLYAVPADKNMLVTVDFAGHSVQTATIQPRQSLLERLLASGVTTVYAKMLNGAVKSGQLSPDGSVYYLTGQSSQAVKDANGDWMAKNTSLGLQAIRTSDGTELANLPSDVTELNLSTDGKFLLLTQWIQSDNGNGQPITDVMDAATFKVSIRLNGLLQPTRLLDGSLAWLSSSQPSNSEYQLSIYTPGTQTPRSQWIEPDNVFVAWILIP